QGFLMIRNETTHYFGYGGVTTKRIGGSSFDSALLTARKEPGLFWEHGPAHYVYESLKSWKTYHFHDTSKESALRRYNDFVVLKTLDSRGVGLASLLYYLQTERYNSYQEIVRCLRLALPFFDDFVLEPNSKNKILLNWRQKGLREYSLNPTQFSDGSLRFICLVAALLQPELPTTLVIDEPELGLHPAAIGLLAELIQGASQRTQIVVATQSAPFLDYFKPENVIVANRSAGESTFTRLEASDLNVWLEDYTLGELWNRNILAGGPVYER
ncbi:MAG: AAA family ATPase, partial [Thermoguttaceae bacterium]|nr:AAA family ATPase [Thermoguttaceae bacterium]